MGESEKMWGERSEGWVRAGKTGVEGVKVGVKQGVVGRGGERHSDWGGERWGE